MKYRAKITNCISHIRNVKRYANITAIHDAKDTYIEVNTEEEADLIEDLNYTMGKAVTIYTKLIELTCKEILPC